MSNKKSDITIKVLEDNTKEFRDKVYKLLDSNKDAVNPLSQLINKDEFENLNENEREKMILNISEQYTEIRKDL